MPNLLLKENGELPERPIDLINLVSSALFPLLRKLKKKKDFASFSIIHIINSSKNVIPLYHNSMIQVKYKTEFIPFISNSYEHGL